MERYQQDFITFLLAQKALLFGKFELKSGRVSPYFFNAGQFNTAYALSKLGQFYAAAIKAHALKADILYGPAYKGIPLVASVAISLYEKHQIDFPFCFNRKEKKPYGEGGILIGAPLRGQVLVVDDVVSSGTTFKQSVELISKFDANIVALITALDREEIGMESSLSAIDEIKEKYKIEVITLVKLRHIIDYLAAKPEYENQRQEILKYQQRYGKKGF